MSNYAVIATGGKQYRVAENQVLCLETLPTEVGKTIDFDQILMVANGDKVTLGTPTVKNAKVTAEVLKHGRHKKVRIIKFKRRKHHMKQMGHRQNFTEVKITQIAA